MSKTDLSRRGFISGAAIFGLSSLAVGLSGCSSNSNNETPETKEDKTKAET